MDDTERMEDDLDKPDEEDKVKLYTGLTNISGLMQVFQPCEPFITFGHSSTLSESEQVSFSSAEETKSSSKRSGFRFKGSYSTVSRVWHKLHGQSKFYIKLRCQWQSGKLDGDLL